MNILLTGATGFLGNHLLPMLLNNGYSVIALKRTETNLHRISSFLSDIKFYDIDTDSLESIFRHESIDIIIHLATNYRPEVRWDSHNWLDANIHLPTALLNLGTNYNIKGFINTGTTLPTKYSLYSASKNSFDLITKFFASNYNLNIVNLKLETMYGQNDNPDHFIPLVIERAIKGQEIKTTKGKQNRDFVFVKDVVYAYIATLKKILDFKNNYTEINIGTGRVTSLINTVIIIEEIMKKKIKIDWGAHPYRKHEIFEKVSDITVARKLLKWEPKTSLEIGLKDTVNWHKKNIKGYDT